MDIVQSVISSRVPGIRLGDRISVEAQIKSELANAAA
jgi:hypothetical protein